jgi:hypothetical protein
MISLDNGFFLASSSSNLSLAARSAPSGGGFVYRGQSDESWGLTSTYYRRFNLNKSGDKQQPTQKQFQDYHETLIKDGFFVNNRV